MSKVTTSICVTYESKYDWHIFQSEDIKGLYVASKDARVAYNDIKTAIEKLVLLNEGLKCVVQPELNFDEFLYSMKNVGSSEQRGINPAITTDRRYLLQMAA